MSKRVLLIKLTSMGDLMHALPALTDAAQAIPGIQFDWVVDEAFAEVPSWHPAVNTIIRSAHRRWKKNLWRSLFGGQLKAFYRQLNNSDYDIIVDAQNNIKSALITFLRRGKSHGLDQYSLSEKPAHWAYHYQHSADKNQHAISRQRQLFAQSIGYPLPTTAPNYGIDRSRMQLPALTLPERFLIFVHNASWSTKLWPEQHWQTLISTAKDNNYTVLLPCGNDEELQRAQRLAAGNDNAIALPKLSLSEVGAVLEKAAGVISCDTGLCHLAGILGVPSVSFYGPTDHRLIGATGDNQHHIIASSENFSCTPCYSRSCQYDNTTKNINKTLKQQTLSACMASFQPQQVWTELNKLMTERSHVMASD